MKVVRLALAGLEPPVVEPPDGDRHHSLAERARPRPEAYEVAKEALPDVPGDGPGRRRTLEEFRVRDVDRPIDPAGRLRARHRDARPTTSSGTRT